MKIKAVDNKIVVTLDDHDESPVCRSCRNYRADYYMVCDGCVEGDSRKMYSRDIIFIKEDIDLLKRIVVALKEITFDGNGWSGF